MGLEFLGNYNLIIQYYPEKEILAADALLRLFVCLSKVDDGLNPNWAIIYSYNMDQDLSLGTSHTTRYMIIQNKNSLTNKNNSIL